MIGAHMRTLYTARVVATPAANTAMDGRGELGALNVDQRGSLWTRSADGSGNPIDPVAISDDMAIASGQAVAAVPALYDGAAYDRGRSATAANINGNATPGVQLVTPPGNLTGVASAVTPTPATLTIPAVAGRRIVVTALLGNYRAFGAVSSAAELLLINSAWGGGGAVLWYQRLVVWCPIGEVRADRYSQSGLNIYGAIGGALGWGFSGIDANTAQELSVAYYRTDT